jgi:hypothetical protein
MSATDSVPTNVKDYETYSEMIIDQRSELNDKKVMLQVI